MTVNPYHFEAPLWDWLSVAQFLLDSWKIYFAPHLPHLSQYLHTLNSLKTTYLFPRKGSGWEKPRSDQISLVLMGSILEDLTQLQVLPEKDEPRESIRCTG